MADQSIQYWLVKSEPEVYSFEDLQRDGKTHWDGVRNFQARNNLKAMKKGDEVLIYHSQGPKEIVGIAAVLKEFYPDPDGEPQSAGKPNPWVMVDLKPLQKFKRAIHLSELKSDALLKNMALIKQSRLSVMPVSSKEFAKIVKLSQEKKQGP